MAYKKRRVNGKQAETQLSFALFCSQPSSFFKAFLVHKFVQMCRTDYIQRKIRTITQKKERVLYERLILNTNVCRCLQAKMHKRNAKARLCGSIYGVGSPFAAI